jgi:hypothetical protein
MTKLSIKSASTAQHTASAALTENIVLRVYTLLNAKNFALVNAFCSGRLEVSNVE